MSATPINSNATINSWGLYVYGKSQAKLTINGAAGAYGSTIKSYSIETNPSIGSASASTLTTGILYKTGTITVTAKVTDSRGRTATATTSLYIYYYGAPYFTENTAYRCNSSGTRDDAGGTYAYVKSSFSCYTLNGNNSVTGSVIVKQVGGKFPEILGYVVYALFALAAAASVISYIIYVKRIKDSGVLSSMTR